MSSRISKIAKKSVVIVADKKDHGAYCSGCVVIKDRTVTVIAPSDFVKEREKHLKVIFFDRTELDATVVAVKDSFCLLRTAFHSGCEMISLLKDDLAVPQSTFMFVPMSRSTNRKMETFATVESLQSYLNDEKILMVNSSNYSMVSCDYYEKTHGVNRLCAAPVFTMLGKTAGIVLQNCREEVDEVEEPGDEMKVVLKATHLRELIQVLLDTSAPPRKAGKKRKRGA